MAGPPDVARLDERPTSGLRFAWDPDALDWDEARAARTADPPGSYYDRNLMPAHRLLRGRVRPLLLDAELRFSLPLGCHQEWLVQESARRGRTAPASAVRWEPTEAVWPLIDLALQLARHLDPAPFAVPPGPVPARHRGYPGRDSRARMVIGRADAVVALRPSLLDEIAATAGGDRLQEGARAFLIEFAREVRLRAPDLFDWETVGPLRAYLNGSAARRGSPRG